MKVLLFWLLLVSCCNSLYGQEEKYIRDGENRIHLTVFGSGDPVLIINGGPGMNSNGFQALAEIIGKSHKAILYDQRGTGESYISEISEKTLTLDLMVEDIETIREYLNIDSWIVLGHSFGGMLGSYYTSKYPVHVKGLILSSSGGLNMDLFSGQSLITAQLSRLERDSLNYWSSRIQNGDTTYYALYQRGKYLAPAYLYDKSFVPVIAERLTQVDLEINQLVFQNMRRINFDCTEQLRSYNAPVLIIQGREDVIPLKVAEVSNRILKNSRLVIMEECGHYGWLDQPDVYFKAIENFLSEVEN